MKKFIFGILFLFIPSLAFSQTVTILANSLTFSVTVDGTTVNFKGPTTAISLPVVFPAATAAGQVLTSTAAGTTYTPQTPATSSGGLPAGITYSPSLGLNVNGPITSNSTISGTELSLTSGTAPATSTSGFYVYSLTNGVYTLVPLPPFTVTQLATPPNTYTITP